MIVVDAENVAANLTIYLKKVAQGETVIIAVQDRPVAELRPAGPSVTEQRPHGLCTGEFIVSDSFDEPLPADILADFEGR